MKRMAKQYETWSKEQLIQRIRQLEPPATKATKTPRPFDFSKHRQRFVALKFAYLGWNYLGLAFQYEPTPLPTVEKCIVDALAKAKLIERADPECCDFARCGRTDRGVSAMNQVISLKLRSQIAEGEDDSGELPYVSILNSMLPDDIRVTAVCLHPPPDFNARFLCLYRHYRYFFEKSTLDIERMREGAKLYLGVHDFRNFCKVDGLKQITNFTREIHHADICHLRDNIYYFDLKGSAFLWHQVRCMMAMLFMVGQKLEDPLIITDLMDIEKYPQRPVYEMANDIPLVLYDCTFPEMEWITPPQPEKLYSQYRGLMTERRIKLTMTDLLGEFFIKGEEPEATKNGGAICLGDGTGRNYKKYTPIASRQLLETPETINSKYRVRKGGKK